MAETLEGRLFAIQAKNYGAQHSITKSDVDKFLSESNRALISERLLIASTDHLASSALDVMRAPEKPVSSCLRDGLRRSEVDWPRNVDDLAPVTVKPAEPRPHQLAALEDIDAWADSDAERGQVVMACGTGKSLIEAWAADRLRAKKVLVLVPTLPLLRQTASVWARHAATKRRLLSVAATDSDPKSRISRRTTSSETCVRPAPRRSPRLSSPISLYWPYAPTTHPLRSRRRWS